MERRELLEIQRDDLRALLVEKEAFHVLPAHRPIRTKNGWGKSDKPDALCGMSLHTESGVRRDLATMLLLIEAELQELRR